jgi:hypothetical protein
MYLKRLGLLVIGFYAWMITIFFGAILLDILYANLLSDRLSNSAGNAVFSNVSDSLLWLGFMVVLAAIGAVVFSWKSKVTRNLFLASLLIVIFEFIVPVFFSQLIVKTQTGNLGPWLRIVLSGSASILAFIGLYAYSGQK